MALDRKTFFASVRDSLFDRSLSQRQVDGMNAVLDAWDASGYADDRWLAYCLGTAYHETGRAMYPVREGGRGKGHPYGVPGADGQIAYGRGYVQLTWAANYAKADKALGLGGKLVANFDLALDPATAAKILFRGMAEGWFTAFKLPDYLNDHLADYLHARRIVNGMDRAQDIAGYALHFFDAINAGEHKGADTSAVTATKTVPAAPVAAVQPAPPLVPPRPQAVAAEPPAPAPSAPPPPLVPAPSPAAAAQDPDPLDAIVGEIESDIGSIIASGVPSAPASAPPSTTESNTIMEALLPILEGLFTGVAGKIGVASTVAGALPTVVEGTIANISEAPKAIADINALVSDIRSGKWGNAPADVHALLVEFGLILKNYGINLSGLTSMVNILPSTPAIPTAAATAA